MTFLSLSVIQRFDMTHAHANLEHISTVCCCYFCFGDQLSEHTNASNRISCFNQINAMTVQVLRVPESKQVHKQKTICFTNSVQNCYFVFPFFIHS